MKVKVIILVMLGGITEKLEVEAEVEVKTLSQF
jgi:hypothetical protein